MSRPARRPSRIRPPHRGRTPSASSTNRLTHEVQPFVRPDPPRTGRHRTIPVPPPPIDPCEKLSVQERRALLLVALAIIMALVFIQMNSNLIAH